MSEVCQRLHEFVNGLEVHKYPFADDYIPMNGIYFFFEEGEYAHDGRRIVRVGTHRGRHQLRGRLRQHFVNRKSFQKDFRENVLEALKSRRELRVGEPSAPTGEPRTWSETDALGHIRTHFSFAAMPIVERRERLLLESRIIGTIARCHDCSASESWLGLHSPKSEICASGLWQTQKLRKPPLSETKLGELISSYSPLHIPEFDDRLLRLVAQHLYEADDRNRQPGAYVGRRLAGRGRTFLQSFRKACRGESMEREMLARYTWSNLGWRFGAILRAASGGELTEDDQQRYGDLLFRMLVHLYKLHL